ncbi:MAG: alpha-glucuronidase family glycosyl hydrolase [Bacteroidota bacterium]
MRFKMFHIVGLSFLVLMFPLVSPASSANLDFTNSVIVTPPKLERLEIKAITVLREEIQKRTGIQLSTLTQWPKNQQSVIAVGQTGQMKILAGPYSDILEDGQALGKEGFRLSVKGNAIFVAGNDPRGVLYGIGKLLRTLRMIPGSISVPEDLDITTSPRYPIRGHQLGYRPKTNAYDAWSPAQFDQYIRELALFGANSIEIIPPRTDDDLTSPHMKLAPIEMMIKQAEIIDSYGMDVWIWYPNMGNDYTHPDSIREELQEREDVFKKLKRIDAVFVPGGDPGDLHPDVLFAWLDRVAEVLNKYHPRAKIWVSPQAFRPTKDWLGAFYRNVNLKYPWFGGVVFGPWVKTPLPEIRKIVDPAIPIRRYPDITHSISCQYPVKDWDLAFAMTLGRECYNPRPVAEKVIHNVLDEFAGGSISYSEGINDDVNKFIWSDQDWDPKTPVIETLREYARFFIDPDASEGIAQGISALERNWQGPLIANKSVEVTLKQWKSLEKQLPPDVVKNYRFQMGLLRAYYDAYIRERLIHETALESEAREVLRDAAKAGSQEKIEAAQSVLNQTWAKPVAQDYKERCWTIADHLFEAIGSQTSVKKHKAAPGRGDFMDYIDTPLSNVIWLLSQFERIQQAEDEQARLVLINQLLNWDNPGPGGFYDNLGQSVDTSRLTKYPAWEEDPGSLRSPQVSFAAGLRGQEWVHTVRAVGFDGIAIPLAWMNQITTLYETPLSVVYENLDPHSSYVLRVAYTGRFQAKIRLTADDKFQIHEMRETGTTPISEFPIPHEATRDGRVKLTWTCAEGERGTQVAELWLIVMKK